MFGYYSIRGDSTMNPMSVPNRPKNNKPSNNQSQIGHAHIEPSHAHGLQHLPFVQSQHWNSSTSCF